MYLYGHWIYSLIIFIWSGMLGTMTIENLAALATVIFLSMTFAGWAVTSIVTMVIRKEVGKLIHRITEVDKRVLRLEIHNGLDIRRVINEASD